jgi:uncharacterized membrane protein YphA (DoxX/SURF4 family)
MRGLLFIFRVIKTCIMSTVIRWSRTAYSLGIIAMAIQQLIYGDSDFFSDVVSKGAGYHLLAYIWNVLFALSGVALLFNIKGYIVSLVSAGVFLLILFLVQLPHLLFFTDNAHVLFDWAPVNEASSFAGASLIVAGSYSAERKGWWIEKLIPFGGFFFSVMLVLYGLDHFFYTAAVATMVPAWIPAASFWTYLTGTALVAAGIAITFKIQLKWVGGLLALMFFIWFLVLHIPRAWHDPAGESGLELRRVFIIVPWVGIALLLALSGEPAPRRVPQVSPGS